MASDARGGNRRCWVPVVRTEVEVARLVFLVQVLVEHQADATTNTVNGATSASKESSYEHH